MKQQQRKADEMKNSKIIDEDGHRIKDLIAAINDNVETIQRLRRERDEALATLHRVKLERNLARKQRDWHRWQK